MALHPIFAELFDSLGWATKPVTPAEYRGWKIRQGRWPEPDWMAEHPDYDASWEGEEDGWVDNGLKAYASTHEALCEEIDIVMDEHPHFRDREKA